MYINNEIVSILFKGIELLNNEDGTMKQLIASYGTAQNFDGDNIDEFFMNFQQFINIFPIKVFHSFKPILTINELVAIQLHP